MTTEATTVIGGVDTHKQTHYAAVIDDQGRLLGHRDTGQLLRALTLDPAKDYQPQPAKQNNVPGHP